MSNTRINETGELKQGRWASSPALLKPLKANLVALRCSTLLVAESRAAVWGLQAISMVPGAFAWAAAEIAPDSVPKEKQVFWLTSLCLNPEDNREMEQALPKINEVLAAYIKGHDDGGVMTEIGRTICDTLTYCSESKCLAMIEGKPRLGKTWAAKKWCAIQPSRARFCEVPSAGDDLSFFTAIARALGVTIESDPKVKKMRPRVESVLKRGDITLVLDEAAALWPATNYRQMSRPPRVSWIMEMINAGASIALLVTPNFFASQQDFLDKSRWQDAQFYGRIERYAKLPDKLSTADLEAVARVYFPTGTRRTIEVVADAAALSQKHLALIEHTAKRANYLARQANREKPEFSEVAQALKESALPGDKELAVVLNRTNREIKMHSACLSR